MATNTLDHRRSLYDPPTRVRLILEPVQDTLAPLHVEKDYFITRALRNVKLINIVALGIVRDCTSIDFDRLLSTARARGVETRTMNRFPSVNLLITGMTVIVFRNGKIVFTGTKKLAHLAKVSATVEEMLAGSPDDPVRIDLDVKNMVAMTNCHHFIDLEGLCLNMNDIIYEPEQFPAAIYKRAGRRGVFLVFSNSKIICLGFNTSQDIAIEMERFLGAIHEFARHPIGDNE